MDKTIRIADKDVTVRKTFGTELRYKRQFGREFQTDLRHPDSHRDQILSSRLQEMHCIFGFDLSRAFFEITRLMDIDADLF